MVLGTDRIRSRLGGGSSAVDSESEAVVRVLEGHLEDDEPILYRLPGKDDLAHETDKGDSQTVVVSAEDDARAIVTDRRVLFVVAGPSDETVIEISHLDLKNVDADDGLLRSKLTVEVWGAGSYSLRTAGGETLGATVQYLRDASICWRQVIAALEDAEERTAEMGEALETGDLETAREAREGAQAKLDRAESKAAAFEYDTPSPMADQIEETRIDLAQTQIRGHFGRAKTLTAEADAQTESGVYTDAFRNYWHARDHLETALSTARKADLSKPAAVESKLDEIERSLEHLRVRPIALAHQAVERAEGTEKLEVEADAWQEAFEHFRDALTAGWGTEFEFSGDQRDIQFQCEVTVANHIDARRRLAIMYEQQGDEADGESATDLYAEAMEHLETAKQLSSEFRAGDVDHLDASLERVAAKRYGQ